MQIPKVSFNNTQRNNSKTAFKGAAERRCFTEALDALDINGAVKKAKDANNVGPVQYIFSKALAVLRNNYLKSEKEHIGNISNVRTTNGNFSFTHDGEKITISMLNHKTGGLSLCYKEETPRNTSVPGIVRSITYFFEQSKGRVLCVSEQRSYQIEKVA